MSVAVEVSGPGWVAKTLSLVRKDLRVEARARETLPPMLAFSLAVTLLLAFTLPSSGALEAPREIPGAGLVVLADVLAGFLWVTVLFAGLIGFARAFEIDRADGALDALLLVPLDRSGLFAAKALTNLISLIALQVILFPVFALFFGIDLGSVLGPILLVMILVDIGFCAIGTLFSSLAAQTRSRELILPILALPALVPVFIAAVELTSDLFIGGGLGAVTEQGWFGILIGFDVIFVTLGALAFEFTLD